MALCLPRNSCAAWLASRPSTTSVASITCQAWVTSPGLGLYVRTDLPLRYRPGCSCRRRVPPTGVAQRSRRTRPDLLHPTRSQPTAKRGSTHTRQNRREQLRGTPTIEGTARALARSKRGPGRLLFWLCWSRSTHQRRSVRPLLPHQPRPGVFHSGHRRLAQHLCRVKHLDLALDVLDLAAPEPL